MKMMLDDYHVNRTFLWDDKQMRMGLWDLGIIIGDCNGMMIMPISFITLSAHCNGIMIMG